MRLSVLAIVVVVAASALVTVCAAQITCPAELQAMATAAATTTEPAPAPPSLLLTTLLQWCTADERCAMLYHQSQRQNMTVFRHLVEPVLYGGGGGGGGGAADDASTSPALYGVAHSLLCTGASLDDVTRRLWLLVLAAERDRAQPICDVNHELVLQHDSLRWQCTCRPDRPCSDRLFELVPFYIVLTLVALAALAVAGSSIYRAVHETRTLRRANGVRPALEAMRKASP